MTKIQSIFVREQIERLSLEAVAARWTRLAELSEALKGGRADEALRAALEQCVPAQSAAFVRCFTDYNNIRAKVQDHCLLELWTVLVLFYAVAECGGERAGPAAWGFISAALDYLVQNTFYISLIVIKAVKNRLIAINRAVFEGHVKALQRFNYETGIPLIKTLKANNELVTYNLRRACEALSPRLQTLLERFTDQRALASCELAFEQSAAEFAAVLRKSEHLLPAALRPRPFTNTGAVRTPARPPLAETHINEGVRPRAEAEDGRTECPSGALEAFPRKCSRKYTLVLDLDETLIHFKNDVAKPKFLIRPNAYNLLKTASRHFEIIIFTAAQKEYADWILDKIDSKNNIVHRLYREHCQMSKTSHLKDLSVLGRDLSKTIIVDNFAENFSLHRENGICIRSWYGDLTDTALFLLEKFLNGLAEAAPADVRRYMKAHIENNPEKGFFLVY